MTRNLKQANPASGRRDVTVYTSAYTTHHVDVDLTDVLSRYDVTDRVVLTFQTPSGRAKRMHVNGSFLVEPHHVEENPFL